MIYVCGYLVCVCVGGGGGGGGGRKAANFINWLVC